MGTVRIGARKILEVFDEDLASTAYEKAIAKGKSAEDAQTLSEQAGKIKIHLRQIALPQQESFSAITKRIKDTRETDDPGAAIPALADWIMIHVADEDKALMQKYLNESIGVTEYGTLMQEINRIFGRSSAEKKNGSQSLIQSSTSASQESALESKDSLLKENISAAPT